MTEIDPGNPYSPHKSWNNRTEREELVTLMCKHIDGLDHLLTSQINSFVDSILEWNNKEIIKELETAIGKEALNIYNNGGFTVRLEWLEHRIKELKAKGEEMNCPDCKGQVELDLCNMAEDIHGELRCCEEYYRCPKCKQEYEIRDLMEEE